MKSVSLSNSILVVTSPPDALSADFPDDAVVICDQVNEIIELAPSVPKLHTLSSILKGREYDDGQQDEDTQESNAVGYIDYLVHEFLFNLPCRPYLRTTKHSKQSRLAMLNLIKD
jgi:hypothetical protein